MMLVQSLLVTDENITVTIFKRRPLLVRMEYGRGDSFTFDSKQNGFPFDSKTKRIFSPQSYSIQFESKWKYNFLSVHSVLHV